MYGTNYFKTTTILFLSINLNDIVLAILNNNFLEAVILL